MKLYWSSRSPFVRKVMVAAHETGLAARIQCRPTIVSTTQSDPELARHNPLGQIPTLVVADGSALYDSSVICEYLDCLHKGAKLFPRAGFRRVDALKRHALGDGMMELLVRWMGQRRRFPSTSDELIRAYQRKLHVALDHLEKEAPGFNRSRPDIGDIAIGCALSYIDFRFAEEDWRSGHPALSVWHAAFAERPSAKATEYVIEPVITPAREV